MVEDEVVIRRGLPDELRGEAVTIFEEAFGAKMRLAIGEPQKRMAFMHRVYDASHVVAAARGHELLGMAGLRASDGAYRGGLMDVSWDPRRYRDLLGLGGAVRAILGVRLADHRPEPGELYIDGVAVAPAVRGQGIGTRLLDEITVIAREEGMRWVRLEVVDTNPRAQRLYERVGYKVTKVQSFRYMERWTGFGGMVSMELPVPGATMSGYSPP